MGRDRREQFGRGRQNRFDRGGGSFSRDNRFGGGSRQMFDTVCSNCGKNCQVPFRPTGEKPVFCSECFEKKGGGERRSFDRPRRDDRGSGFGDQLSSLNSKLDKIITLLETKNVEGSSVLQKEEVVEEVKPAPKKARKTKVVIASSEEKMDSGSSK